jgi:hypothetical protein
MPEGLKLIVGADVTQAEAALKDLTKEAEVSASKIDRSFNKTVGQSNTVLNKLPSQTKPAIAAISKLGDSLETLRAKLLARQNFLVQEKDIAKVAILNKEIKALEDEIIRVGNAGKAGFDDLGNALTKATGPMNAVAGAGSKVFGALRTIAYIVPGIGIAGLISGLTDLVIGLFKTSDAFDEGAVAAAKYKLALDEAKNSLLDFFTADVDVEKLRNKLKFGDSFTTDLLNFKVDKTANDKTVAEANAQAEDLIKRIGYIRSNAALFLSEEGQKLINAFFVDSQIPDDLIDKLGDADKKLVQELKLKGIQLDQVQKDRNQATQNNLKADLQFQIDANEAAKKARDKALADQKKYIADAKELAKELEKIGFKEPQFKFFDTISEQLEKARQVFNTSDLKINKKFFDVDLTLQAPRPDAIQQELNIFQDAVQKGLASIPPVEIPVGLTEDQQQVASVLNEFINKYEKLGLKFHLPVELDFSGTGSQANAVLQKQLDSDIDTAKVQKRFQDIVTQFSGDLFVGLGQAIGDAIGGSANVFDALFKVIAAGMKQFGEALIALGTAKLALDKLFKGPQGGILAIGAGIALIALSTVVSNFQGPKFAQGGLVTGPTLGLVGEGRGTSSSNPEVIAPLDKLKGMLSDIGGGRQTVVVMGKIRGKDLALSGARTSKSQTRLGA